MSELARMAQEAQRQYEAGETEAVGFATDGGDGMKEIKFRAWHKDEKKMIYASDATHSKELWAVGFHGLPIAIDSDSFKGDEIAGWNVDHYLVLMQYTGIKDKNGKDIYEGDICTAEGRTVYSSSAKAMVPGRYTVYWRDDRWHLRDQNGDGYQSDDYYYADEIDWQRCTVIGNIYEQSNLPDQGEMV